MDEDDQCSHPIEVNDDNLGINPSKLPEQTSRGDSRQPAWEPPDKGNQWTDEHTTETSKELFHNCILRAVGLFSSPFYIPLYTHLYILSSTPKNG